ncbi:MAG: hypothetical protein AB1705_15395 [Verrucomicrobiota bacterium]
MTIAVIFLAVVLVAGCGLLAGRVLFDFFAGRERAPRRRIEVTEEDMRLGVRCGPGYCPVARALARAFGQPDYLGIDWVVCGPESLRVLTTAGWQVAPTARRVRRWMQDFDRGRARGPVVFDAEFHLAVGPQERTGHSA